MNHRLFVALPIPPDIRSNIINNIKLPSNFRITKPHNLHITILFLGETDENKIPKIIKKLEEITNTYNAFNLEISYYDKFPPTGSPRIIYVSGENGKKELLNLANEIRNKLNTLGFYDKKGFKYHVTVARLKYKADNEITLTSWNKSLQFRSDKIILYKSDLKPDGPVYTSLWTGRLLENNK